MGRRSGLLPLFLAAVAIIAAGCYGAAPTRNPLPGLSLGVPTEVSNRTPLYECGKELRPKGDEDYNADARSCFWDRNQNHEEAEFIAVTRSDYAGPGGTVTVDLTLYYRTFKDGHVEIITDGRQHPDIAGWTLRSCAGLELAPEGDAPPGVTFFNGKDPCTQRYLLKAGS